jgi:hypothetical protein
VLFLTTVFHATRLKKATPLNQNFRADDEVLRSLLFLYYGNYYSENFTGKKKNAKNEDTKNRNIRIIFAMVLSIL